MCRAAKREQRDAAPDPPPLVPRGATIPLSHTSLSRSPPFALRSGRASIGVGGPQSRFGQTLSHVLQEADGQEAAARPQRGGASGLKHVQLAWRRW